MERSALRSFAVGFPRPVPPAAAAGGGVDWDEKTVQSGCDSTTHRANTHVNITGSGYLMGIWSHIDASWAIQVDGGDIWHVYTFVSSNNVGSTGGGNPNTIRFNTSLQITNTAAASSQNQVWVVTD